MPGLTEPHSDLAGRLDFETLISDLSAKLVTASDETLQTVVEDALGRVIQFFGADRGGILVVRQDERSLHARHAWYAETLKERVPQDVNLAVHFPYAYRLLVERRQPFIVHSYDDVPSEAAVDRASHLAIGVRSTLAIPITVGLELRYVMIIDAMSQEVRWETLAWLEAAYRPERSLADACADALNALFASRGLAVFRAHAPEGKAAAAPTVLAGLERTLPDGLTPVMVEGREGRDRLRRDDGEWVARRSAERFTRLDVERIAATEPERLSPNVLLRPVVEAVLFPTVAYVAGPGELGYLPDAVPLYDVAGDGVIPQTPVPRWSGLILETRIEHVLRKHGLEIADFASPPGALESRLVRGELPAELRAALEKTREHLEEDFGRLSRNAAALDPTLERTAESARNAALGRLNRLEHKLVASLKRTSDTLTGQIARARAALHPWGKPQERALTVASFLVRYGPGVLDDVAAEVARGMSGS